MSGSVFFAAPTAAAATEAWEAGGASGTGSAIPAAGTSAGWQLRKSGSTYRSCQDAVSG